MVTAQEPLGAAPAWTPDHEVVACVTGDRTLLEDCARIAAVAGARLEGSGAFGDGRTAWGGGPLLPGADVDDVPPRLRRDLVLVGRSSERERLWRRAAELGVEHVAELPEASGWLVEFLGRRRVGAPEGAVLGVVGGCGGAGASTTATLLAAVSAARRRTTVLIDGDRLGGGLELCLAPERAPGLAWPDLAAVSGSTNPDQLAASLPRAGDLAYLSWPAGNAPAAPIASAACSGVVDGARRAFERVIVDVGRGREGVEEFGWACEQILVVVPGRLRAALAAARIIHELPPVPVGVVVRGRLAEGIDAERLAEVVGAPMAARLPDLRPLPGAAESGRLPDLAGDRRVRRMADHVLGGLIEPAMGDGTPPVRRTELRSPSARRTRRTQPAVGAA
ncbi:septum site-determining protein Ssd [Sinomonas albida]|uniref:septum site-determining protein Ssd n=1 Tax=Sinomonas albida TaxID=369942 RepID=UPI0010A8FC49|nr:septum site-determining protein Ssd [Sinomonas albida]